MEKYYISCKKYAANENSNVRKIKQLMVNAFIKLCSIWQEKRDFY